MSQKFCTKCGKAMDETAKFCNACGAAADVGEAPVAQKETVIMLKPKIPGRGFGIASMVLGIIGIAYGLMLVSDAFKIAERWQLWKELSNFDLGAAKAACLTGCAIYSVFGILAVIFGAVSRKRGYKNGISMAGLVLSVLSLVAVAVAMVVLATL